MKITLIGVGLIGGSMALKLKSKGFASYIYGVDQNESHLEAVSYTHLDVYKRQL